jgi:Rrf2 family protein
MEVQLSRRGDYAIRAAIALARAWPGGGYLKLREISAEMDIPLRYTHEIVSFLVRGGLAGALAGKLGGFRLARDPETISLLQIVEAAEGRLGLDRCALSGGPCHWQETICAVHPMLAEAGRALAGALRSESLAAVLMLDARLKQTTEAPAGGNRRRRARATPPAAEG